MSSFMSYGQTDSLDKTTTKSSCHGQVCDAHMGTWSADLNVKPEIKKEDQLRLYSDVSKVTGMSSWVKINWENQEDLINFMMNNH